MFYADCICDMDWFAAQGGVLPSPRSSHAGRSDNPSVPLRFFLYGSEHEVKHLRVVMDTGDAAVASACVDANVQFWNRALAAATCHLMSRPAEFYTQPNSTRFMVITGEGDESSPALDVELEYAAAPPLPYEVIANFMTAWPADSSPHLSFFSKFADRGLPPEVRWLYGYRLAEWHFRRGRVDLHSDPAWRALVEKFRPQLEPLLRVPQQTLHGFLESVRAVAAHAVADPLTPELRTTLGQEAIPATFRILEQIVCVILNEQSGGRVTFTPNPI